MKGKRKEIVFAVLAVISVGLIIVEDRADLSVAHAQILEIIDFAIWAIFCVDYVVGIWKSTDRKKYFKTHIIELVAILPFNAMLKGLRALRLVRLARGARIFRFARLLAYSARTLSSMRRFFAAHNFYLVLIFTLLFILCGALVASHFENTSFGDSLWWAFVTSTTVGYGDISPATTEGRITAVILMLVGIGFLGILTGSIASFFLSPEVKKQSPHIETIIEQLKNFDELSAVEVEQIARLLIALKLKGGVFE